MLIVLALNSMTCKTNRACTIKNHEKSAQRLHVRGQKQITKRTTAVITTLSFNYQVRWQFKCAHLMCTIEKYSISINGSCKWALLAKHSKGTQHSGLHICLFVGTSKHCLHFCWISVANRVMHHLFFPAIWQCHFTSVSTLKVQCSMPQKLHFWATLWLQLPVSWVSTDNSVKLQLQPQSCIALVAGHRHTKLTAITAWQLLDSLQGCDEENLLEDAVQVRTESWANWSGTAIMTMLWWSCSCTTVMIMLWLSCSDVLDLLLVHLARFEQTDTVAVDQLRGSGLSRMSETADMRGSCMLQTISTAPDSSGK